MSTLHRAIYGERRRLGLDDDTARAVYMRAVGKDHLTQMSDTEHRKVLSVLRSVGQAATAAPMKAVSKPAFRPVQGPYGKKLTALWIAMWHLGITRDRSDEALVAFVLKRVAVDHTRWLVDPAEARKVIEALRDWMTREAGVEWNTHGSDWLKHDAAKVALAQWMILHPDAQVFDRAAFAGAVHSALGLPQWLATQTVAALSARDWQEVNRSWGPAVRKVRRS